MMTFLTQALQNLLPLLLTLLGAAAVLSLAHWLLLGRRADLGKTARLPAHLTMVGMSVAAIVAVALALPVSEGSRNQVIGLIGVLVSGVVAFSSTHLISNLMAGLVLRLTRSFRTGDFIRVQEHFGRVAERGLLDTEIQTEHRELVSLPNSYLTAHPITVVRTSGAIVSSTLTLGYDVHHARVQPLLLEAATSIGLEDPFVHIMELGNFSVAYRVSGLLTDVKTLLSTRSQLNAAILDTLHREGIEIMSPGFMSQRRVPDDVLVIPPAPSRQTPAPEPATAEEVVFDKAEEAAQRSLERKTIKLELDHLQQQLDEAEDSARDGLERRMAECRERLDSLDVTDEARQPPLEA